MLTVLTTAAFFLLAATAIAFLDTSPPCGAVPSDLVADAWRVARNTWETIAARMA